MSIAFDIFTDGLASNPGNSLSWQHNNSGNCVMVGTVGDLTSDLITGVTYNAVAMAKVGVIQMPTDRFLTLWGLVGAVTGNNTVLVSASSSIFIAAASSSYSGVGSIEAGATTNTANSPATSVTGTVATTAANCWTVAAVADDSGVAISGGTGTTSRGTNSITPLNMLDSNIALSPGNHTLQGTGGAGANWGIVIASLAPSGAAAAPPSPLVPSRRMVSWTRAAA